MMDRLARGCLWFCVGLFLGYLAITLVIVAVELL